MRGGEAHHLVVGDAGTGEPVTPQHIFKAYCAIKPITTIAVAKAVEADRVHLDEPLRRLLPEYRALADHDITPRHVLSHTAGLHTTSTVELELIPPAKREALLRNAEPPPGWALGHDVGYSEFMGWHLLGRVLEEVTGQPVRDHLREAVLEPLEMGSTWLGMTTREYETNYDRLGVNWRLEGATATPMLLELSEQWCCEVNCASGGYTCAGDLANLYAKLAAQLNGAEQRALPSRETLAMFCASARPHTYDVILECECSHGLGFMVDLAGRFRSDVPSAAAFGHAGLAGSVFAVGDPTFGLGVGVIINGIIDAEASVLRRHAILCALYRDLGLVTEG